MPRTPIGRRILTAAAVLAAAGVLALLVLIAALWVERRTSVTLPVPTGSYAVGRTIRVWADATAVDTLAPAPGTKREILAWIWYPSAVPESDATREAYLTPALQTAIGPARTSLMGLLSRDLARVHPHSVRDPDVSPRQRTYPVVIMRAGASLEVWNYSTLAEDLASHGFIVVGIDAPYRTGLVAFPDGRVARRLPENNPELCFDRPDRTQCVARLMNAWTSDIGFALDRLARLNAADPSGKFTGRLDLARVGVFGHSFGGAQAAQFCHDDPRCKAAIDIDGAPFGPVIQTGLDKPFMFLFSDLGDFSTDAEVREIKANVQSIYDRLPPDRRVEIGIRGANHFTFSDDGALLKSRLLRGVLRLLGKLRIDGRRQLAVTAYCVHTFFDEYLKGEHGTPLDVPSPLYPEIKVLR